MNETLGLIDAIYQNIQNLEIQPTEHNVMIIADCYIKLKDAYKQIKESELEEETDDGR